MSGSRKVVPVLATWSLSVALAVGGSAHAQSPLPSPGETFNDLSRRCVPWVDVTTMSAVVRHESKGNRLAIGVNGKRGKLPRQPKSLGEALATAKWLQANGYDFDVGLGQLNVRNLPGLSMTLEDAFDPCANLRGSGVILADCYGRASRALGRTQSALHSALSCYNTNDLRRGFANGYVGKVVGQVGLAVPAILHADREVARAMGENASSGDRGTEVEGEPSKDVFAQNPAREAQKNPPRQADDTEQSGPVVLKGARALF